MLRRNLFVVFALGLTLVSGAPAALAAPPELGELLTSPAGRYILVELGVPEESVIALGADSSVADPDRLNTLKRGLLDIRSRYLREHPEDRRIFEESDDEDLAEGLRRGQRGILRDLVQEESGEFEEFRDAGQSFRNYTALRDEFLAGGAASGDSAIAVSRLPQRVTVSINRERAEALFGLARDNWLRELDGDEMDPWLKELGKGNFDVLTPEVKARLKALRKHSSILRSSFQVFGEGHEPPRRLHEFVRDFGKLNDAIENDVQAEIRRAAKTLRDELDVGALERQVRGFEPASRRSYDDYVKGLFKDIRKLVARERLPAEKFHELRKEMKDMLTVFQLIQLEGTGANAATKAAYDFLFQLNEEMGLLHDHVVGEALHGEAEYDESEIRVPGPVRDAVNGFVDRYENN